MEHLSGGRIPILKMGEFLLVSIQVDLHDQLALSLQCDLLEYITRTGAHGVLLDISALDVVDSFIGRMVGNIAKMSRLLGAETVLVGMRPTVAITMIELGVSLKGVHTALNLERGAELLQILIRKQEGQTAKEDRTREGIAREWNAREVHTRGGSTIEESDETNKDS